MAVHRRGAANGRHTTTAEHMASHHKALADWIPERIIREAGEIGSNVAILCERIIAKRAHREQVYRACIGIVGLKRRFVSAARHDIFLLAMARNLPVGLSTYGPTTTASGSTSAVPASPRIMPISRASRALSATNA